MGGLAILHDLVGHPLGDVRRDREADADGAGLTTRGRPARGRDGHVDADELPVAVDERPTRVARVDGRVGLDDGDLDRVGRLLLALALPEVEVEGTVLTALAVLPSLAAVASVGPGVRRRRRCDLDRAVERTHDSRRDGVRETQRCADGDGLVADVDLARVAELDGGESGCALELDHREVVRGVGPHHGGRIDVPIRGGHRHRGISARPIQGHDVGVRQDVAVGGEDDAGTGPAGAAGADVDGDDARDDLRRDRRGGVDLVRVVDRHDLRRARRALAGGAPQRGARDPPRPAAPPTRAAATSRPTIRPALDFFRGSSEAAGEVGAGTPKA